MLYFAPLFGSFIATLFMMVYAAIESSINFSEIFDLLMVFPITFALISSISYALCLPIGFLFIKLYKERLWSDGFFMFICSVCGTIIGLVFSIISFNMGTNMLKVAFIFASFFAGSTFTSSFYISMKKELAKADK